MKKLAKTEAIVHKITQFHLKIWEKNATYLAKDGFPPHFYH